MGHQSLLYKCKQRVPVLAPPALKVSDFNLSKLMQQQGPESSTLSTTGGATNPTWLASGGTCTGVQRRGPSMRMDARPRAPPRLPTGLLACLCARQVLHPRLSHLPSPACPATLVPPATIHPALLCPSPHVQAPEVLHGQRATAAADVFSFAMVMLEASAAALPRPALSCGQRGAGTAESCWWGRCSGLVAVQCALGVSWGFSVALHSCRSWKLWCSKLWCRPLPSSPLLLLGMA